MESEDNPPAALMTPRGRFPLEADRSQPTRRQWSAPLGRERVPALRAQEPRPPRFVTQSLGLFYFPDTHSSNPTAFENRFIKQTKKQPTYRYTFIRQSVRSDPTALKSFESLSLLSSFPSLSLSPSLRPPPLMSKPLWRPGPFLRAEKVPLTSGGSRTAPCLTTAQRRPVPYPRGQLGGPAPRLQFAVLPSVGLRVVWRKGLKIEEKKKKRKDFCVHCKCVSGLSLERSYPGAGDMSEKGP